MPPAAVRLAARLVGHPQQRMARSLASPGPSSSGPGGHAVVVVLAGTAIACWTATVAAAAHATATAAPAAPQDRGGSLALDLSTPGSLFEGVGALSGGGGTSRYLYDYPEAAQEQILDALFDPTSGGALQMLKIEIGGDTWSTQATEPSHMHTRDDLNCSRGYEWRIAAAARKRNPSIALYGLSWGTPGWVGNGTANFFTQENILYQTAWLRCMREAHGLEVDWLGLANERPEQPTGEYVAALRSHLDAQGFGAVRLVGGDDTGWKIVDGVLSDPALYASLDRVSSHYPMVMGGFLPTEEREKLAARAKASNHSLTPLWASEDWHLGTVSTTALYYCIVPSECYTLY